MIRPCYTSASTLLLAWALLACAPLAAPAFAHSEESGIFVDAVAASVNGRPITLREVGKRLTPPRRLTLKEASNDPQAREVLDVIILEKVLADEAEAKKIIVSDEEIGQYLEEIAARNGLSVPDLQVALEKENRNLEDYKRQIRTDILKSKLASSFVKGGVGVSKKEIDEYLNDHPELSKAGKKVKLRQIFVSTSNRSPDEAREILVKAKDRLSEGEEFGDLAKELSEAPEAAEGGLLDLMAETEMHPKLFDALFSLDEDEVSEVTELGSGLHLFKIEERLSDDEDTDKVYEEAEKILKQQKAQERMSTYFTDELFKQHSVDKKI